MDHSEAGRMAAGHMTRGLWHKKRILTEPPEGPCVLTGFWRHQDAQAYERLLKLTENAGVPMQRWQGTTRAWPWTWVRSSLLPGERMGKPSAQPEQIRSVAGAVAALHHIRSGVAGPLWGLRWAFDDPTGLLMRRCRWAIARSGVPAEAVCMLEAWLVRHEAVFRERQTWALTHGDLKAGNLIWNAAEERVYLIDYEHMRYHWPELEVAALVQGLYGRANHRKLFLQHYLAQCPQEVAQNWERHAEVYEVTQLLTKAFRRWRQWRFPWFARVDALSPEQRLADIRKLVEKAYQRASVSPAPWR